jgi:hypothetical protein
VEAMRELLNPHPTLTLKKIAHREGIAENTVRAIAKELGVDTKLYLKRIALTLKRESLLENLRAIDAQIAAPITKSKEQ